MSTQLVDMVQRPGRQRRPVDTEEWGVDVACSGWGGGTWHEENEHHKEGNEQRQNKRKKKRTYKLGVDRRKMARALMQLVG